MGDPLLSHDSTATNITPGLLMRWGKYHSLTAPHLGSIVALLLGSHRGDIIVEYMAP